MGVVEYQPHQIVFLSCGDQLLYAEVIQSVRDRDLCWARPLAMITGRSDGLRRFSDLEALDSARQVDLLVDLRQASDLLLPLSWFQIAVDTEVMPVLTQLGPLKSESASASEADNPGLLSSGQDSLQRFVRALCQKKQQSHESLS